MGVFALYLISINLLTVFLFSLDKRRAKSANWRVPENALLGLAILGGSIGAKFAQHKFRHKTHKQPFGHLLNGIIVLQAVLVIALMIPQTRVLLLAPQ